MTGQWQPVLFHNDPPNLKHGIEQSSNGEKFPTTAPVAIESDEEPGFRWLQINYPLENFINAQTS